MPHGDASCRPGPSVGQVLGRRRRGTSPSDATAQDQGGPETRSRFDWLHPFLGRRTRRTAQRIALLVATAFVAGGIAWILGTDIALYRSTSDQTLVARIETAKGWAFVLLGGILIYVVTLRTATRVIHAEVVLSAVVESIGNGVLLLGPDRSITYANRAAVRMLHCESARDLIGMGPEEFSRQFRLSYLEGALIPPSQFISQRVFTEGGPLTRKSVLHPPGAPELVFSATAAAVRDEMGAPAELVVSVLHDITDSEHMERLRDEFFAASAHSLKTPIAIVKANAQILTKDAAPRHRRAAGAIERQCDRIDHLVENMLVLARVRSRTLQLYPEEVDLAPLVERTAREVARQADQHAVHTEVMQAAHIRADPERLVMVLRNLVDAALRMSLSNSDLTLLLRRQGADAEFGVRYHPLPPEEQACNGLGADDELGINRRVTTMIVEAHGGTVREETEGTEVTEWVRLPAIGEANGRA